MEIVGEDAGVTGSPISAEALCSRMILKDSFVSLSLLSSQQERPFSKHNHNDIRINKINGHIKIGA